MIATNLINHHNQEDMMDLFPLITAYDVLTLREQQMDMVRHYNNGKLN